MALVTGDDLDPNHFFKAGSPLPQGSSFDLTVGSIFDDSGKKVEGLYTIKPGHMVQVVSAEIFCLSSRHTGHVSYKTTLTRKGIWALTVGIVDPGWDGPISTTLLNFSKVDYAVSEGDAFLRVSFFEHDSVPRGRLRKAPELHQYLRDTQKSAASIFPATFLNSNAIAQEAGEKVLARIRKEALPWVALIVFLFGASQWVSSVLGRPDKSVISSTSQPLENAPAKEGMDSLKRELEGLRARIRTMEASRPWMSFPFRAGPLETPPSAEEEK